MIRPGSIVAVSICALLMFALHMDTASAAQPHPSLRLVPPAGKTLLIIGQDMDSVGDYLAGCAECPPPGGVTAYLGFYSLLDAKAQFGGLGEDAQAQAAPNADWGAGKTSAARVAALYPQSALVLGVDISDGAQPGRLHDLSRGVHDDKIIRLAAFCRATKKPVYLRIGYEFDGTWNRGYEARETYIAAFRRIVDVVRSQGANNVAFVWQASASPIDDVLEGGSHESIRDWYPGADYVDWMGFSWFLLPQELPDVGQVKPPTQQALADELLKLARLERKPVMIAEATPQGYDLAALTNANISPVWDGPAGANVVKLSANQIWNTWYEPFFALIHSNADVIRAVAYINARWDSQPMWSRPYASGYWGDSRIQANPDIEQRWLHEIRGTSWLHGGPALSSELNLD